MKDPEAIKGVFGKDEEEDDEEANEDLSLKILEKALSRRDVGKKVDTTMSDLSDSGVISTVMVNGGKSKSKDSESSNKVKKINLEAAHEIPIVWKDQDEDKVVDDVFKGEEDDDEVERSAEPKTGETFSNMVLKKLLRGARYFDPPDAGWVSCYSCGEQGHITVNCPTPTKRRKPCFICGGLEHGAKQCPKGQDCYICKKVGHRAKDCPDKYKSGSKGAICLRCGDFGHDMILCKYEYSQDDLKDIQCYVCKSFGHLCCVEPGNSQTWAVSCYRCGQLGHTGLACGRHYNDIDQVSANICFKCGGEGHLKRDCPNSSSVSFPGNNRDLVSVCYRCGEEGHFSRECPNSSSISTSHRKDSRRLCYHCRESGHFSRECPNSSQASKRNRDTSPPSHTSSKKSKEESEHSNTPHESNGKTKKKKAHKEEKPHSTPKKPKHRGGWITEDPEENSFQREKIRRPRSPITPSSHNHRLPTTPFSHNHRSQAFSSSGHFPDSRSPIPHGRNHRNASFESNGHHSGPSPSRWQPYDPPTHHHNHHNHHNYHQQHHRYEPAPSRYGPRHHYIEYAENYDRR